jgi:hypothetical protein
MMVVIQIVKTSENIVIVENHVALFHLSIAIYTKAVRVLQIPAN